MQLDSKPTIPNHVISRQVDEETVLLDLASGVYFGLDGVGQRIWELISEQKTIAETAATLTAEFEVEEDRAQTDVVDFVSDLIERGLLLEN